ncbi:hypothetical protein CA13_66870 [Planctomycetes bacterium CA13]|uniref:Uncharacterized protein n=1 Tax=Novipirellula herctigrandis TaxID=2527986 RepID=A0A5C5YMU9_9BACT|nr:hypothetical protein CA13_66870 [Planctomycetes bacterium CA13]
MDYCDLTSNDCANFVWVGAPTYSRFRVGASFGRWRLRWSFRRTPARSFLASISACPCACAQTLRSCSTAAARGIRSFLTEDTSPVGSAFHRDDALEHRLCDRALEPDSGGPQARFKRQSLQSAGVQAAACVRLSRSDPTASCFRRYFCGHPALMPSAATPSVLETASGFKLQSLRLTGDTLQTSPSRSGNAPTFGVQTANVLENLSIGKRQSLRSVASLPDRESLGHGRSARCARPPLRPSIACVPAASMPRPPILRRPSMAGVPAGSYQRRLACAFSLSLDGLARAVASLRQSWFIYWRFKRRSLRSSVTPMQFRESTEVPTAWLRLSLRSGALRRRV